MDKEFIPAPTDYELSSDDNQSDGIVKQGNEQDRLDMERLGQRQQLSVRERHVHSASSCKLTGRET